MTTRGSTRGPSTRVRPVPRFALATKPAALGVPTCPGPPVAGQPEQSPAYTGVGVCRSRSRRPSRTCRTTRSAASATCSRVALAAVDVAHDTLPFGAGAGRGPGRLGVPPHRREVDPEEHVLVVRQAGSAAVAGQHLRRRARCCTSGGGNREQALPEGLRRELRTGRLKPLSNQSTRCGTTLVTVRARAGLTPIPGQRVGQHRDRLRGRRRRGVGRNGTGRGSTPPNICADCSGG